VVDLEAEASAVVEAEALEDLVVPAEASEAEALGEAGSVFKIV
jgi:hypothetical protein